MEYKVFDNVNFEKQKDFARFDRFRRIAKFWHVFEVLMVLGLISWSSIRVPTVLRSSAVYFVEFSAYLLNHHVVFLIGNAIIVLLFMLCRRNNDLNISGEGDDFYDDYVKHSEAAAQPALPPESDLVQELVVEVGGGDEEKQIVIVENPQTDDVIEKEDLQNDAVAAAIEEATRKIKRFQRTQSEKLKRDITVRSRPELRRSETENRREMVRSVEKEKIESLSNEEFQRTVDAFINEHWSKGKKINRELLR